MASRIFFVSYLALSVTCALSVTSAATAAVVVDTVAPPTCPGYKIYTGNVGLVMGNHLLKQVNASSSEDCCAACTSINACVAFTFSPKLGTCRMTSSPIQHSDPADVVSGLNTGRKPVPVPPGPSPGPGPAPPIPPPKYPDYCKTAKCKNVLYILSDDMRADWGAYGLPAITPNLDALSSDSLLFEHAFCQISVCSPSRQSFMTSRRPDRNQVWNFIDANPLNSTATPGHFRDHGYLTLGLGKTFHENSGAWNADAYWSLDKMPYFPYSTNNCPHGGEGGGHCILPDDQIWDWHLRNATLQYMDFAISNYQKTNQPFYVMTGFRDPHAPWAAPQRMWDLYNNTDIAVPTHKTLDPSVDQIAWSKQLAVKLANGTGFDFGPYQAVPDWVMQDQRRAYYAAISYVDEHVGDFIGKLKAADLYDDCVIVFHADHGYQLGEHGMWEKKSNWDLAVRVPLMIKSVGKPNAVGVKTATYTDLVDVFPTVSVVAGLPVPVGVDGDDVSAIFDDPTKNVKEVAFHQYPACNMATSPTGTAQYNQTRGACNNTPKNQFKFMGYSIRTPDYRYTLWVQWNNETFAPDWGGPFAEELYDHTGDNSTDMDKWENLNLASDVSKSADKLALRNQLQKFFSSDFSTTSLLKSTE